MYSLVLSHFSSYSLFFRHILNELSNFLTNSEESVQDGRLQYETNAPSGVSVENYIRSELKVGQVTSRLQ